jgi:hypothetical protein
MHLCLQINTHTWKALASDLVFRRSEQCWLLNVCVLQRLFSININTCNCATFLTIFGLEFSCLTLSGPWSDSALWFTIQWQGNRQSHTLEIISCLWLQRLLYNQDTFLRLHYPASCFGKYGRESVHVFYAVCLWNGNTLFENAVHIEVEVR